MQYVHILSQRSIAIVYKFSSLAVKILLKVKKATEKMLKNEAITVEIYYSRENN